jgi:hypothetical protein
MSILGGSPRVDITISVNPQFELRLDHASIQKCTPTAADFDGNRLEIGHARSASSARWERSPPARCCL